VPYVNEYESSRRFSSVSRGDRRRGTGVEMGDRGGGSRTPIKRGLKGEEAFSKEDGM